MPTEVQSNSRVLDYLRGRRIRPVLAALVGAAVGISISLALAMLVSQQSLDWHLEQYYLIDLAGEFLWSALVSGMAGAMGGIAFACAYSNTVTVSTGWRFTAGGALCGSTVAMLLLGVVMTLDSNLFRTGQYYQSDWVDVLEDVRWLIFGPGIHGAWVGAIIGLAVRFAFARQGVGAPAGAFGTAVVASCVSAFGTFVYAAVTAPGGDAHGAGIGPGAGHAISVFLVYVTVILPVSLTAGASLVWFRHQQ